MKLLFIGNSHTYYNGMPETVRRLFEATGQRTHVTMLAEGGKGLSYHATSPNTLFNIRCGEYDAVIVQDKASGFEEGAFRAAAAALLETAQKAESALYFFMPWITTREDAAAQSAMSDAYRNFCYANGCFFAPVGEVFARLRRTEPIETLYREDGSHATPFGSYVAAVTIFYTVTGRKRIMKVTEFDDPGVKMGFSPELCQRVHTEACRMMRLYNG